jgi:hypothetical protein
MPDTGLLRDSKQKLRASGSWVAGGAPAVDPVFAGRTKEHIFITRITICITTSAAESVTVRDDGTPTPIFSVPASAAVGAYQVELGDDGYQVGVGLGVDLAGSGAGTAGTWVIEGYRAPSSTPRTVAESASA